MTEKNLIEKAIKEDIKKHPKEWEEITDGTIMAIQKDYLAYSALMPFREWIQKAILEFGEDNISEWKEAREEARAKAREERRQK